MSELVTIPVDSVQPHPDNPRRGDVNAIARSLETFGQQKPIVVQRSTMYVVAGNHTLKAAKQLGWTTIQAVIQDLDDVKARAYLLADNKTSDAATYEKGTLLRTLGKSLSSLEGTGFTPEDFETLQEEASSSVTETTSRPSMERDEITTREVSDAPEPTREIPLRIKTSMVEEFAQEVYDLQEFWEVKTFPEVVLKAVRESHDRWKAGVGRQGRVGSQDSLPKELRATTSF